MHFPQTGMHTPQLGMRFPQLDNCNLCPRACGARRNAGQAGVCGADDKLVVARAALHEWEEPPISVGKGSGTVFFSNCSLRCVYCQNAPIAHEGAGKAISNERLSEIFCELQQLGAANINLVTPTHYAPQIACALERARTQGLELPVVYNTSGYERSDCIEAIAPFVDVWLCDFKYWKASESDAALRYSHAPDYFEHAAASLDAMVRLAGEPRFDTWSGCASGQGDDAGEPSGDAGAQGGDAVGEGGDAVGESGVAGDPRLVRGVVVRHLLLPGRLEDSKRILAYLASRYGASVLYSIMSQYTPMQAFSSMPELASRPDPADYEELLDYCDELGLEDYYWQDGSSASESFIPPFDHTGV